MTFAQYVPSSHAGMNWAQYKAALDAESRELLLSIDVGHVYVVEFTSGVVKVGKTVDPRARIAVHGRQARAHAGDIRGSWVSREHLHCGVTERRLIEYCAKTGELVAGREYFRVSSAKAASYASMLAFNYPSPADMGAEWQESYDTACREAGIPRPLRVVAA